MTDPSERSYLNDVSREVQDLIYEKRMADAIQFQMAAKGLNKMEAMMDVGGIASRMQAAFPEAMPEPPSGAAVGIPPVVKNALVWTFLIGFALVAAIVTFVGGRGLVLGHQSNNWPSVPGEIVASSVEHRKTTDSKGRSKDSRRAMISYRFEIDGTTYKGKRVDYAGHDSGGKSARARELVRKYPKGKKVTVYYKPGNPNIAVLEPGSTAMAFGLPGLGLFMLLISGGLIAAAIAVARDERRETTASTTGDIFKSPYEG